MTRKALICPYGFMGDALFASSVARKLKEEDQFDVVDLATGLNQVEILLARDPYINNIIRVVEPTITPLFDTNIDGYDAQFRLTETNKEIPPPTQFQLECGVKEPDTKFELVLDPYLLRHPRALRSTPYIAYMNSNAWLEKAFRFTEKEYIRGIDVPYYGYGGRLRNIHGILHGLRKEGFELVEVGLSAGMKSLEATRRFIKTIDYDAALIKNASFFIGAEGGLANIAAAVHTPTILTGEFVHQLYGYNGVLKKIENPKLGPRFYWPEDGHIDLSPYLTDEAVVTEMIAVINGTKTAKNFTYEWTKKP